MKFLLYCQFFVVAVATLFTISIGLSGLIGAIRSSSYILLGVSVAIFLLGTSFYFLHEMYTGDLTKIASHAGSAALIYLGAFVFKFGYNFLTHQELVTGFFAIGLAGALWFLAYKFS